MRSEDERQIQFDIIIGNPPYLKKEDIINSTPKEEISAYEVNMKVHINSMINIFCSSRE